MLERGTWEWLNNHIWFEKGIFITGSAILVGQAEEKARNSMRIDWDAIISTWPGGRGKIWGPRWQPDRWCELNYVQRQWCKRCPWKKKKKEKGKPVLKYWACKHSRKGAKLVLEDEVTGSCKLPAAESFFRPRLYVSYLYELKNTKKGWFEREKTYCHSLWIYLLRRVGERVLEIHF